VSVTRLVYLIPSGSLVHPARKTLYRKGALVAPFLFVLYNYLFLTGASRT